MYTVNMVGNCVCPICHKIAQITSQPALVNPNAELFAIMCPCCGHHTQLWDTKQNAMIEFRRGI